ncbi:hypothetical protein JW868_00950 [Candidatus Woesearchaeota archaeon]|nr:hypothetical protein [Candidatus Woesearchaeota archaeon]
MDDQPKLETRIDRIAIVAWYGTSLQEAAAILRAREFPPQTPFRVSRYRLLREIQSEPGFDCRLSSEYDTSVEGAYKGALNDARARAFYHALQTHPGIKKILEDYEADPLSLCPAGFLDMTAINEITEMARREGIELGEVDDTIERARPQRGVVLGIERKFFTGKTDWDFDIDLPYIIYPPYANSGARGLPASYIGGIHIRRSAERQAMNELLD